MRSPAELLAEAMRGDATAAAELWRAIAEGRADEATTLAWAREVAGQVVAKVLDSDLPANRRAEKARQALGLEGRVDAQASALEELLRMPVTQDMTAGELAKIVDLAINIEGTPEQLKRRVQRIRQKQKG
jgi:hypothetical protein